MQAPQHQIQSILIDCVSELPLLGSSSFKVSPANSPPVSSSLKADTLLQAPLHLQVLLLYTTWHVTL